MTSVHPRIPYAYQRPREADVLGRATEFCELMRTRRSVREFSKDPVPIEAIERCIEAAAQAPSGANKQPWTFCLVTDPAVKRDIRIAAEAEEKAFYHERAPRRWLDDLKAFGTDEHKPFLETAPALIVLFAQRHGQEIDERHYYVNESVGIAAGILLSALHGAGLAALTHTPSPMKFLSDVLRRPKNERAYLLIPVGYPARGVTVPDIERKRLDDVLIRYG